MKVKDGRKLSIATPMVLIHERKQTELKISTLLAPSKGNRVVCGKTLRSRRSTKNKLFSPWQTARQFCRGIFLQQQKVSECYGGSTTDRHDKFNIIQNLVD